MHQPTDHELLGAFVQRRDEHAFAQIVARYMRLVYASARRQVRDAHVAEDVTQAVFIVLAKKAAGLRDGTTLAGWLVNAARLVAKTAARSESRRQRREQRMADMTPRSESQADDLHLLLKVDENLDSALSRLSPADRTAITLRFLQDLSMREVAEQMGTTEAAANKRVTRAVAKLREMFRRKGFTVTPAVMTTALLRQAQVVVPPELTRVKLAASVLEAARAGVAVNSTAAKLAHDALAGANVKLALGTAAALLLLIGVIAGGAAAYFKLHDASGRLVTLGPTTSAAIPATVPASQRPLRVGVYISHDTSLSRFPDGRIRGWADQFKIFQELQAAELDLRPLLEPGVEKDSAQIELLDRHFRGKAALDVTDGEAFARELDVILVNSICEPREEAIDAIESAVRGGAGLVVRQCFGGHSQRLGGYGHPKLRLLRGLHDVDPVLTTGIRAGEVTGVVVTPHPLLGTFGRSPRSQADAAGLRRIRNPRRGLHGPDRSPRCRRGPPPFRQQRAAAPAAGLAVLRAQRRAARQGADRKLLFPRCATAAGAATRDQRQVHPERPALGGRSRDRAPGGVASRIA